MNIRIIVALCVASALLGCSTPSSPYRDPGEGRGRTVDFTTYDFQQCANALADDILSDPVFTKKINEAFDADCTPIVVARFENLTYQHDATDKLKEVTLETIMERLQKSGRFDFVDRRADGLIASDWIDERDGVSVADDAAESIKNAKGADYILHATLTEFREGDNRVHDVYYKMSARFINKRTKNNDWVGSKEIRKVSKRAAIGW